MRYLTALEMGPVPMATSSLKKAAVATFAARRTSRARPALSRKSAFTTAPRSTKRWRRDPFSICPSLRASRAPTRVVRPGVALRPSSATHRCARRSIRCVLPPISSLPARGRTQELAFLPEDVSSSAGSVLGSSFGDERDCPHGFEAIPLNTSSLPWEQQAAFKAADPFGCLDICCDEELLQEGGEAGGGEAAAATADVVSDAAAQAASMATSQAVSGAIGAVSGGG